VLAGLIDDLETLTDEEVRALLEAEEGAFGESGMVAGD
jgi:hypothetical protein